jgi:hypothetical protein
MAAAIHSVISQAVLNTISVKQKMRDLVCDGETLSDLSVVVVDSNAVATKAAMSEVQNYLPRATPQVRGDY